jgi:hypothetical protein
MLPPPPSPTGPTPPLLEALLGESVVVDRNNGKMSLLGILETSSGRGCPVGRLFSLSVKIRGGEGPFQCLLTLGSRETAALRGTGTAHATLRDQPRAADSLLDLSPVQVPKAGRSEFQNSANNQFLGTTSLNMSRSPVACWKEAA